MRLYASIAIELIGLAVSVILGLQYAWWPHAFVAFIFTQLIIVCIWGGIDTVIDAIADAIAD